MPPKTRKYDSGYEKRKKKKREEELIESQRGALNKFFTKEPQVSIENQTIPNVPTDLNLNLNMPADANVFIDGSLPTGASIPIENDDIDDLVVDDNIFSNVPVEDNNVDDVSIENNTEFDDILAGNDTTEQTLLKGS
ncbi:hypothetical protein POM88_035770 [Heracleum sosnowskyi]|uniref:Uncharacterized protein n=1 Tax=Heracleum sosnowskyi TaxID=360622 RepID=A0AAD8MF01_9APIA|nr:hypothetical protein POM88_035770 [Heracleum sosnowskyi]